MGCHEGHEGDEEEGSHEAPCHEGSGPCSHEGHEGDEEEGSHEAPCHEGSGTCSTSHEGHAGDEEEGSHEAPCHEGSCSTYEGHEGHEVNVISASSDQDLVVSMSCCCLDLLVHFCSL